MRRKIFLILLVTIIFNITNCNASTNTYNREDLKNYGVNKKWEITEERKSIILKTPAVNAEEKIYDFSEVLTDEEEKVLKEKIDNFIEKNNMDLVIITYNLPYTVDKENEDFAADFYDYNDFGLEYEKYDGIVLFRNTYESNPYYDMYTFGNSQLYFDDTRYNYILDNIYNDLHSKNYISGFSMFIDETSKYISSGIPNSLKDYYVDDMGYLKIDRKYEIPWMLSSIISLIVTIIIMSVLINRNKMVKKAETADEYLDKKSIKITNKEDKFITSHTTSYTTSSSSGSSGGGGFSSSSGSSGGGHSSGGGRHG